MTDIVEELRRVDPHQVLLGAPPYNMHYLNAGIICHQAAAEIERLRVDAARYRELLQRIVESVSEPTFDDVRLDYIEVQIDRDAVAALAGARTALEGER